MYLLFVGAFKYRIDGVVHVASKLLFGAGQQRRFSWTGTRSGSKTVNPCHWKSSSRQDFRARRVGLWPYVHNADAQAYRNVSKVTELFLSKRFNCFFVSLCSSNVGTKNTNRIISTCAFSFILVTNLNVVFKQTYKINEFKIFFPIAGWSTIIQHWPVNQSKWETFWQL